MGSGRGRIGRDVFMMKEWSLSQLTRARPDIWARGLELAGATTGVRYVEKRPLPDGSIFACGGGGYWYPPVNGPRPKPKPSPAPSPLEQEIEQTRSDLEKMKKDAYDHSQREIDEKQADLDELLRKQGAIQSFAVCIPSGAMEWLLHEVGHWVAASDADRRRPDYGPAEDQEVPAWAFEEAVLSHLGPARHFAPPTQRDGAAFSVGPIPGWAFRRIDTRLADGRIDVEPFQLLWAEWVAWGRAQGHDDAPWRRV